MQSAGRSINLALSVRGISSLEGAGVGKGILETLIPMKGRMIHTGLGKLGSQAYGVFGESINSVDRRLVNQHLLASAETHPNVTLLFEQEFVSIDFDKNILTFKRKDGTVYETHADLIVGADGAYSRVRREMMRVTRMNFAQEYIEHGYVELNMPPTESGEYKMASDHLHIWPRQTFMMIALPNIDKSFTVTLFMPWSKFDAIKTKEDLLAFFESTFPDSMDLIGRELLVADYFKNPKGPLMSVKCKPYHYKKTLIIGDAAHAMVPFYGQGMNCGFEDTLVLEEILDKHIGSKNTATSKSPDAVAMEAALAEYSIVRNPDAEAMCDLAMYNYIEMRSSVTKWTYLLRKRVESFLHKLVPQTIIPLYTMVSFTRIPYAQAMTRFNNQTAWFNWLGRAGKMAGFSLAGVLGLWGALKVSGVKFITFSVNSTRLFLLK